MSELLDAIVARDREKIYRLVHAGVDLNAKVDQGATVLFLAVINADPELVRLLLDAGADPNVVADEPAATIYHQTPLDLAHTARYLMDWDEFHPMVCLLHEYGARDVEGNPTNFSDLEERERGARAWQLRKQ